MNTTTTVTKPIVTFHQAHANGYTEAEREANHYARLELAETDPQALVAIYNGYFSNLINGYAIENPLLTHGLTEYAVDRAREERAKAIATLIADCDPQAVYEKIVDQLPPSGWEALERGGYDFPDSLGHTLFSLFNSMDGFFHGATGELGSFSLTDTAARIPGGWIHNRIKMLERFAETATK